MNKKLLAVAIGAEISIVILGLLGLASFVTLTFSKKNSHDVISLSTPLVSYGVTVLPTTEPSSTPHPTSTPIPTSTPDPVPAYKREVVYRMTKYGDMLTEVENDVMAAVNNPTLFKNRAWIADTKKDTAALVKAGDELVNIPNVPQFYMESDGWLKRVGIETRLFADDFIMGIDTMDATYLDKAAAHMDNINTYIRNAAKALPTSKTTLLIWVDTMYF